MAGTGDFSLRNVSPAVGPTQPSDQWVLQALFLGAEWAELEADHSPSSRAGVKNKWRCTHASNICLHYVNGGQPFPVRVYCHLFVRQDAI